MSVTKIKLRRLLRMMGADPLLRARLLREDLRKDRKPPDGKTGGGDFYGPFWASAKAHALGTADLQARIKLHIDANPGRAQLYPELAKGFLTWWDRRRRWTNAPFAEGPALVATPTFPSLGATVGIENLLSVRDSRGELHAVYPYLCKTPVLTDEIARLGLWVLTRAFQNLPPREIRILDVLRGQSFSTDKTPLQGNEEQIFLFRYTALIRDYDALARGP